MMAGATVLTGASVSALKATEAGARLTLDDGSIVEAERVLMAVGRRPNSNRGGLADRGIAFDRGFVANDDDLSTSIDDVYVAGDLSGRLQFTHAADHMGRIAVGNILGRWSRVRPQRFRAEQIPWVTFLRPEIARIGRRISCSTRKAIPYPATAAAPKG